MAKKTSKKTEADVYVLNNMEVHREGNYLIVSVNPRLYPLSVVYSAAYHMLDEAYVILFGDPNEEILVEMRPKDKKTDVELLGRKLNNELVNCAVYQVRSERNRTIRDAIVKKAFETNNMPNPRSEETEGIIIPWDKRDAPGGDSKNG